MYYDKGYFEKIVSVLKSQIQANNAEMQTYPQGTLRHDYSRGRNRIFIATTTNDGKKIRESINKRPDILLKLLRREYLSAQNVVLEKDIRLLENFIGQFVDTMPASYIERMPERFHTLPLGIIQLIATANPLAISAAEQIIEDPEAVIELAESWFPLPKNGKEEIQGDVNKCAEVQAKGETQAQNGLETKQDFRIDIGSELDNWARAQFEQSTYKIEQRTQRTSQGLLVRSKSEALIAEKLYEFGVPFRYEQVLHIGCRDYFPDFAVRNTRSGKLFYWEHLGLVNNKDYMESCRRKLATYENAGIAPWDNLITTYDDENGNLDLQFVESIIKCKLT